MSKKSITDNINYFDDPNGRKWSWGNFKYIGEFTAIDFIIIVICFFATIPLFFIPGANIMSLILWTIFAFMMTLILIAEFRGEKLYEKIWNSIIFIFKNKKIDLKEILNDDENIYEVLNGFDISNLSKEDISKFDNQINDFFTSINGIVKIYKFNSTFRVNDALFELHKKANETKSENKQKIIYSYLENIESFKKSKMPNIYIKFTKMDEREIKKSISYLNGTLDLKKINADDWQSIKMSNFNIGNEFKYDVSRNKIFSNRDEKIIGSIDFGRNVKSNYLEELIFNNDISFVLELKKPEYNESIKIKKSIKKWAKRVPFEDMEEIQGKDFFEMKDKLEQKDSKNQVMIDLIVGNDDLRLMSGNFIFTKNKNDELSIKKQFQDLNFKLKTKINLELISKFGKQDEYLRDFYLDFSFENKKWYPVNVSTFTASTPFQNESFLDNGGAYIGTSSYLFPFVFNAWKTGTSGRHMGILAKTGGGKTILMKKLMISDEVLQNSIQYILDPKNDGFSDILEKFGGEKINVSKSSLNPLKFDKSIALDNFENEVDSKALEIQEFLFILFKKEINHGDVVTIISEFSDDLKIFLMKNKSKILKEKELTFSDLEITFSKIKKYNFIFKKLVHGTYSIFNKKETINFNNKSIVFELHELMENPSEEMKDAKMFLVLNKIIDEIYYRQDKKKNLSLWIDEAGDFFKSQFLTKKLEKLMVKSRSFNTKICWATQNPTDLIGDNNKSLASIFANTEHLFIGQLKDGQIGVVNEMFKVAESESFSEVEKEHIKDSASTNDKGKFIYINSSQRHLIQTDYENDYFLKQWVEEWKEINNRG